MIPKQVITYWEGERPEYIDFCLKSIKNKCGVDFILLTPDNIEKYIDTEMVNQSYKNLNNISQKADYLRLVVLYLHGGMWCDADTLAISSFERLFETDDEFLGMRWNHNKHLLNGYFFAQKRATFIKDCIIHINNQLRYGLNYYSSGDGCAFGEATFEAVMLKSKYVPKTIPLDTFCPIDFPCNMGAWSLNNSIDNYITKRTVAIAINNSQNPCQIKTKKINEIMSGNNLMASIFKYYIEKESKIDSEISIKAGDNAENFLEYAVDYYKKIFSKVNIIDDGDEINGDSRDEYVLDCDEFINWNAILKLSGKEFSSPLVGKIYIGSPFYYLPCGKEYDTHHFHFIRNSFKDAEAAIKSLPIGVNIKSLWHDRTPLILGSESDLPYYVKQIPIIKAFLEYNKLSLKVKKDNCINNKEFSEILKKYRLPMDFSPLHPDWKVISKRQRYAMALSEIGETDE